MTMHASEAQKLMDFSQKLDINLLDSVINSMYYGGISDQRCAQQVLTDLKDHPDSWTRVDTILEFSQNQQTKFFALQILEPVIKTKWKVLPKDQTEGIKKYIVGLIIKISSTAQSLEGNKVYLWKLNVILVQILKQEWPKNWPTFIPDIVGASRTNEYLCQNNMIILKLLSEEVFDFSEGQLVQNKARHLKDTMCNQFSQIFQLCQFVLVHSDSIPLIEATLETLLRFLSWIPLGYIFETNLTTTLSTKFFPAPEFRNVTLQCLTEIASITVELYNSVYTSMFDLMMTQLQRMLSLDTNLKQAYNTGGDAEQKFVQNLSVFFAVFLKEHGHLLEKRDLSVKTRLCLEPHHYLLSLSQVEDTEIFKICLEYWNFLTAELYREERPYAPPGMVQVSRKQMFADVLTKLRFIIISRMAKPEEVLVVENDQGEVVREFMKDTDAITLYKSMRETLVYLAHLDYVDTERIMQEKLQNQVNGTEWSWKNLNTLCWAIGSISGSMHEDDEKKFLVLVIKDLLGLCEQKKGKDNKAIIASNIMYVVGQYPRFLRAHWKFLKTVVNKLFEFMHETHDGVQDMACDTFIKIAQKCRRQFVNVQLGEVNAFVDEIISNISIHICELMSQQVHTFYEAVAYMVSAQTDSVIQQRLIDSLMQLPNQVWDNVIMEAKADTAFLADAECCKQLLNILRTNVRIARATGHVFYIQLGRIYLDMLNIYKCISENINSSIEKGGETMIKQPLVRCFMGVRKEMLRLIATWISSSNDPSIALEHFLPPLYLTVLPDYKNSSPAGREPEVFIMLKEMVVKLSHHIVPQVPKILDEVFPCTLEMINKDLQEWPDHRTNFFVLLQAIFNHCFDSLLAIPPATFKLVVHAIIWAIKHQVRSISESGLAIMHTLLTNVSQLKYASIAPALFNTYFDEILSHLFALLSDNSQCAALSSFAMVLSTMFCLAETGNFPVKEGVTDNVAYVKDFLGRLLHNAFPHLTEKQISVFVTGCFSFDNDQVQFKEHLRDLLVQVREFRGQDDGDLFLEEKEQALQLAETEKQRIRVSVPGILNPHEVEDIMQD